MTAQATEKQIIRVETEGLSEQEIAFCREAIKNLKRLKPAIMEGDQYRLVAPYNGEIFSGDYLMKIGIDVFSHQRNQSMVIEIEEV